MYSLYVDYPTTDRAERRSTRSRESLSAKREMSGRNPRFNKSNTHNK